MLINLIKLPLFLGYSERTSIHVRMIIIYFFILLHCCLTKTFDLTFFLDVIMSDLNLVG